MEHRYSDGICANCGCSEQSVSHFGWKCTKSVNHERSTEEILQRIRTEKRPTEVLGISTQQNSVRHSFTNGICTNCGCSAHSIGHFGWKCKSETNTTPQSTVGPKERSLPKSIQPRSPETSLTSRSSGNATGGITGGQIVVGLLGLVFVLSLLIPKNPKAEYEETVRLRAKRLEREAAYERVQSAVERVDRAANVEAIMRDRERHPERYRK